MLGRLAMVAAMGLVAAGCAGPRQATPEKGGETKVTEVRPATRPAGVVSVEAGERIYEGKGVRVGWPAGWERVGSEEYVLVLEGEGGARISLDVPELPAHVPGLIPLGLVVNGYRDDLRKQEGTLEERDLTPPAGALGDKVRRVRSAWDGGAMQETAVIAVHDDRVYILRGRSDAGHERATQEAMEEIVGTWRWTGRK